MDTAKIIESILLIHGEPISIGQLSKLLRKDRGVVERSLADLRERYKDRGIVLVEKGDAVQFGTHPDAKEWVEEFVKSEFTEDLTKASLETLAVIAYKGPLTRVAVDYIRGVNSSFILRNLLMRGLVTRRENPDDARSYLYEISFDFLKYFGMTRPDELPRYLEMREKEIAMAEAEEGGGMDHTDESSAA